jgi:hypothetical protein
MSTALKPVVEAFSFDGELVGVAGAAALRKVRSLAESAPQGRLFASISTLSDNAGLAAAEYEAASLATLRHETEAAAASMMRGNRSAKKLKQAAEAEAATPLPAFIRRSH